MKPLPNEHIALVEAGIQAAGDLPEMDIPAFEVKPPKKPEQGDYACPVAMMLAKPARMKPFDIANAIVKHLPQAEFVASAEVAPPGFVNFRLSEDWLRAQLDAIIAAGADYATLELGASLAGIQHAAAIDERLNNLQNRIEEIDATRIERLDSAGAQLLSRLVRRLNLDMEIVSLKDEHRALFDAVVEADTRPPSEEGRANPLIDWFEKVGRLTLDFVEDLRALLSFLGQTIATGILILFHPHRWPVTATVHHIQQTGLNALPLVALLSFLVGAVVAFLGATVLRDFGAELFVVDLTTYAFLREFGVLLTAIILAGRTQRE